ncbi:MAG: winged helix-turn-helix transcriptional regulator [Catenulispora sp.]|nr:winged helix-turn-helix transcriptional regulator [Catenulispora sp.]
MSFTAEELALVRFSVSPMWQVVTSFRVLSQPGLYPVHGPWFDQVRPRLAAAGLLTGRLAALFQAERYIPDFLNPVPGAAGPSLADELAAVRATPEHHLSADLDYYDSRLADRSRAPFVDRLRTHRDAALSELTGEIEQYFQIALAPYWARIRTLLDADVYHRARQVAEYGAARLFNELHPDVSWNSGTLQMLHRQRVLCRDDNAPGLILVPSAFAWNKILTRAAPGDVPQLCYGARGVGTVFARRAPEPSEAVAAVIGRSRALLLAELESPASTTELAARTGMSAGGVSEHLTALRGAGMVSAHRAGRSVLYARTSVADSLLAAAV